MTTPAMRDSRLLHDCWLRSESAERAADWRLMEHCLERVLELHGDDALAAARLAWARDRRLACERLTEGERADLEERVGIALDQLCAMTLVGEPMFYRSLVAASRHPERAARDWRALIRQRRWHEESAPVAGDRLLRIGDSLRDLGMDEDARLAYARAEGCGSDVGERLSSMGGPPGSADAPPETKRALSAALGALAAEPPDLIGLRDALRDLSNDGLSLPPLLAASLPLLAEGTTTPEALAAFVQAAGEAGADWTELCPVAPAAAVCTIVERALDLAGEGRFDEADQVLSAAQIAFDQMAGDATR